MYSRPGQLEVQRLGAAKGALCPWNSGKELRKRRSSLLYSILWLRVKVVLIFTSSWLSSCEICRHDKLKCDGQLPCSRCARSKRRCEYVHFQATPDRSDFPPRAQNAQQTQETQQYSAEKLRLLENIFANFHPNIRTDDLSALRDFSPGKVGHTETVGKAENEPLCRDLTTNDRPEGFGDGLEALERQDGMGRTPMPTATITVINQGKTRTSRSWYSLRDFLVGCPSNMCSPEVFDAAIRF